LIWSAKRFIVTDTLGLLLTVVITAAVQDPHGAKSALLQAYLCTRVRFVFTDGAFAGRLLDWTATTHLHHRKLLFSSTLSVRNARTTCGRRSRTD
jgi:hypothetical protein